MSNNIPGWCIKIDEVSSGVYKVTLTDTDGRKAEVVDKASDDTINLAKDYAFDIERRVKRPWNKFLFEFCLLNVVDEHITSSEFHDSVFGSWIIQVGNKRIVYDGKYFCLIYQTQKNDKWVDISIIANEELKYKNFIDLINILKK